jgi:hypothetical protein
MTRPPEATFDALFQPHVAAAFERQLRLGDVVGDRAWSFSLDEGTLSFAKQGFFGKTLPLRVQVLGTESESSSTWLWAWANVQSGLPESLLVTARRLEELGEEYGIAELVKAQLPLQELDGHQVGLLASGLHGRGGYRCPYDGGAMFVQLPDVELPPVESPALRVLAVFPQVVDTFELTEPRAALRGLMQSLGFRFDEDTPLALRGTVGAHGRIHARFDAAGRMTALEGDDA